MKLEPEVRQYQPLLGRDAIFKIIRFVYWIFLILGSIGFVFSSVCQYSSAIFEKTRMDKNSLVILTMTSLAFLALAIVFQVTYDTEKTNRSSASGNALYVVKISGSVTMGFGLVWMGADAALINISMDCCNRFKNYALSVAFLLLLVGCLYNYFSKEASYTDEPTTLHDVSAIHSVPNNDKEQDTVDHKGKNHCMIL